MNRDATRIAKAASRHTFMEHGDKHMRPDCAVCEGFALAIITAHGLTPDEIRVMIADGALPPNHPGAAIFGKMFPAQSAWD